MKNPMLALLGLVALLAAPPAAAVSLVLEASSDTVVLGETFTVDVLIDGTDGSLGDFASPSVGLFDLDVSFDDAAIAFLGVTFGSFLGDPLTEAVTTGGLSAPGVVDVAEISLLLPAQLDAIQPDGFLLATLEWQTLDVGPTAIALTQSEVGDAEIPSTPYDVPTPEPIVVEVVPPNVPALGLPGLGVLFVTGLALLGRVSRS